MGAAGSDAGFHRARHGHRVPCRRFDPGLVLRPRASGRQPRPDPQRSESDRGLSRHTRGPCRMSAAPLLEVEGLDAFYGASQILFGVGLTLHEGQTVALLGRNGAGKSTTMKSIAG